MENRKIEIDTTHDVYNWLIFPEVGNYNVSIEIDEYIFKNLDYEIEWVKEHNISYSNVIEIKKHCKHIIGNKHITNKKEIKKEIKITDVKITDVKITDIKIDNIKTYLMKDRHNGLYKIGSSKKPKFRERTLQSEKPSIKLVKICKSITYF